MDDLAACQSFARPVFRVGLEQRPHPFRHVQEFIVSLFPERLPDVVNPAG